MRPAEATRLRAVSICSRIATRRRHSPPGTFRRGDYADQLDRALEALHRAVAQDEREAARRLAGLADPAAPSPADEETGT
jgi:hypothetical protein